MGGSIGARLNGRHYQFEGDRQISVGRDPEADVVSVNPIVSRHHAVVRVEGDAWVLEDSGSRGGTFVDGRRITRIPIDGVVTVRLGDPTTGDELQLEKT